MAEAYTYEDDDEPKVETSRLMQLAAKSGDVLDLLTDAEIARLGSRVVDDYERDETSRAEWRK